MLVVAHFLIVSHSASNTLVVHSDTTPYAAVTQTGGTTDWDTTSSLGSDATGPSYMARVPSDPTTFHLAMYWQNTVWKVSIDSAGVLAPVGTLPVITEQAGIAGIADSGTYLALTVHTGSGGSVMLYDSVSYLKLATVDGGPGGLGKYPRGLRFTSGNLKARALRTVFCWGSGPEVPLVCGL